MSARAALATPVTILLLACQGPPAPAPEPAAPPGFDLAAAELVDLTHSLGEDTLFWPTAPSTFELEVLAYGPTPGGFFYAANAFCTPEHGGTHLDAPLHFGEGQPTADQVPLERLVAPAVVLDVSRQAAEDPDYELAPEDVAAFEAEHGRVPAGVIVLVRTGWSARWPHPTPYFGREAGHDASDLHFPSYGEAAARVLVEERKVAALGVDTASIDPGSSSDFPVHRLAAAAQVPGLENLTNLDRMPATGAWVVALPVKIERGSGAPLRAVGLVPR